MFLGETLCLFAYYGFNYLNKKNEEKMKKNLEENTSTNNLNENQSVNYKTIEDQNEENKQTAQNEIKNLKKLKVILTLGKIAFDNCIKFYNKSYKFEKKLKFKHGAKYKLPDGRTLIASYHPSPRNVNTKVINTKKMISLLRKAKKLFKL
jgi:uracil-DNA glycosylase